MNPRAFLTLSVGMCSACASLSSQPVLAPTEVIHIANAEVQRYRHEHHIASEFQRFRGPEFELTYKTWSVFYRAVGGQLFDYIQIQVQDRTRKTRKTRILMPLTAHSSNQSLEPTAGRCDDHI